MCGITGCYLNLDRESRVVKFLEKGGILNHRGPDCFASWRSQDRKVGLQHYRLAIVDLSPSGNQPMESINGRWVIVFNGEIYNHQEIRSKLSQNGVFIPWRGKSDTETLLEAISTWGVEAALSEVIGMFAFAVYDKQDGALVLARDRLGEKPLYYAIVDNNFIFSSEIKTFSLASKSSLNIDPDAVSVYLKYGYIYGEKTIYKDIFKVPPGSFIRVDKFGDKMESRLSLRIYWSLEEKTKILRGARSKIGAKDLIEELDILITQSIESQMMSDVPIGAFLSGGVDSSLVASTMQRLSTKPINTFTIGFEDAYFNETEYSSAVARFIGSNHTEAIFSDKDLLNIVPQLPKIFCEPFSDPSQLPSMLLAKTAKSSVKVALGGDGADELFGGYPRYLHALKVQKFNQLTPRKIREWVANRIESQDFLFCKKRDDRHGSSQFEVGYNDRIQKIGSLLRANTAEEINDGFIKMWGPCIGKRHLGLVQNDSLAYFNKGFFLPIDESMMMADLSKYLPDDILVKIDRSCMAYGLESRSPFLDHRVVEYALSLTASQKISNGQSKWLLRQLLFKYLPERIFSRQKKGFGCPIGSWLRGPLKDWGYSLLQKQNDKMSEFVDMRVAKIYWEDHLSGKNNWEYRLWVLFSLLAWFEEHR
jgi:asparagine synthase (glutamine-hydrolysing)